MHPPTDGSLLLSQVVDFNSEHNPQHPFFQFCRDESDHVTTITHFEFARACHRVAHIVRPLDAPSKADTPEVVAIIALCDTIVYQALMLGIHKAGLIPFPISPRNTPVAIAKLLEASSCHRVVATKATLKSLLDATQAHLSQGCKLPLLSIQEVPSINDVLPKLGNESVDDEFTLYPDYTIKPALSSVAMYLHSSGSTGLPKPIPLTQLSIIHWATLPAISDFITHGLPVTLGAMALPPFHTMGIYGQVLVPLFALCTSAVYPPVRYSDSALPVNPTPDNIIDHSRRLCCDGLVVIPSLLHYWSHSPESMKFLSSLYIVGYSGGAPPPKLGHALYKAGVVMRPLYGATEFGAATHWIPGPEERMNDEWQWIRFPSNIKINMVPQGEGTFELFVLRSGIDHINVFNSPGNQAYATSDLFEKHPSVEGLWKIVGRKDDVIVHSSGEKTVPVPMEDVIASHPGIQGVIMFGERQSQPGVLLELKDSSRYPGNDEELQSFRNEFWPIVEEANQIAPAFSRVYKDMILFASSDKPLPRAGKGTVMRKAALCVYSPEIQNLYDTIEAGVQASTVGGRSTTWKAEALVPWLQVHASDLVSKRTLRPSDDLFAHGFDSLTATLLRHRVVSALRQHEATSNQHVHVPQTLVYDHPTIEGLADAVERLASSPPLSIQRRVQRIESLISYQLSRLQPLSGGHPSVPNSTGVVLLTGSTGGLGSQILANLLCHPKVTAVYALNRVSTTGSIAERQKTAFKRQGLDVSLLDSAKLIILEGSLNQPDFDLGDVVYKKIHQSVNIIIHNAWKVDFNFPLHAFEPLISGTLNLINFARTGPFSSSTRFLYTSSISAVQSWTSDKPVPEDIILKPDVAIGSGYGESKYVLERILASSGVQACSLRIGQICGGTSNGGAWSLSDWFPILVQSSVSLKALPDAKGVISWIPMDIVSKTVSDVALNDQPVPSVINVVHPNPVPWTTMITAIQRSLHDATRGKVDLPTIALSEWVKLLEIASENVNDLHTIPAIKLMDFFTRFALTGSATKDDQETGGWPKFPTRSAQSLSSSLKNAHPIGRDTVSAWVGFWVNAGLLKS